jgi:hypothetical protein
MRFQVSLIDLCDVESKVPNLMGFVKIEEFIQPVDQKSLLIWRIQAYAILPLRGGAAFAFPYQVKHALSGIDQKLAQITPPDPQRNIGGML